MLVLIFRDIFVWISPLTKSCCRCTVFNLYVFRAAAIFVYSDITFTRKRMLLSKQTTEEQCFVIHTLMASDGSGWGVQRLVLGGAEYRTSILLLVTRRPPWRPWAREAFTISYRRLSALLMDILTHLSESGQHFPNSASLSNLQLVLLSVLPQLDSLTCSLAYWGFSGFGLRRDAKSWTDICDPSSANT